MDENMQYNKLTISWFVGLALAQLVASNIACADEILQTEPANIENNVSISDVYSNVELNLKLAAKPNLKTCLADECIAQNQQFDARVQSLGGQLREVAFLKNPDRKSVV